MPGIHKQSHAGSDSGTFIAFLLNSFLFIKFAKTTYQSFNIKCLEVLGSLLMFWRWNLPPLALLKGSLPSPPNFGKTPVKAEYCTVKYVYYTNCIALIHILYCTVGLLVEIELIRCFCFRWHWSLDKLPYA